MKKEKSSIFSIITWKGRGGGVKFKVKNEIIKSKINRLQRKLAGPGRNFNLPFWLDRAQAEISISLSGRARFFYFYFGPGQGYRHAGRAYIRPEKSGPCRSLVLT